MLKTHPNVIILTSGVSGSSVLTGLIAKAGYWTGDTTAKKEYETYENQELIDLNLRLFKESGFRVEGIPFYDREQYSATEIRERMVKGAGWEKLVPESTSTYIKSIFGDERLRELALSDKPANQQHTHF